MSEPTNHVSTSVSVDGDELDKGIGRLCRGVEAKLESDNASEETVESTIIKFLLSAASQMHDLVPPEGGIATQVSQLAQFIYALSPEMVNPWYIMASPPKPKKERVHGLRSKAVEHYEGSLSDVVEGKGVPAACVISGETGYSDEVVCAHILPRPAPKYLMKRLGINDVDSLRNVFMVAKNIEYFYDRKKVSIVPCKEPNSTGYKMIVWDSSILDEKIFDGSDKTIRDVKDQVFHFADGKTPYTRIFHYQAQASYSYALAKEWVSEDDNLRPERFVSPLLSDILEVRSLTMDSTLAPTDGDLDSCFNLTAPLNGSHRRNPSTELSAEGNAGAGKDIPLTAADGDVQAVGNTGRTALHDASWWGHAKVAKKLLGAGANVNAADSSGSTPLHDASRRGHAKVAKTLLDAGANVNAADNYGNTPLSSASWYGHSEVMKMLLHAGANVDGFCQQSCRD